MATPPCDPLALAKVVAILKRDADSNRAADIYGLAAALQKDLPSPSRCQLLQIIERVVVALRVSAVWMKPASEN